MVGITRNEHSSDILKNHNLPCDQKLENEYKITACVRFLVHTYVIRLKIIVHFFLVHLPDAPASNIAFISLALKALS